MVRRALEGAALKSAARAARLSIATHSADAMAEALQREAAAVETATEAERREEQLTDRLEHVLLALKRTQEELVAAQQEAADACAGEEEALRIADEAAGRATDLEEELKSLAEVKEHLEEELETAAEAHAQMHVQSQADAEAYDAEADASTNRRKLFQKVLVFPDSH